MLMIHSDKRVMDLFIGDVKRWEGSGIIISDAAGEIVYTTGLTGASPRDAMEAARYAGSGSAAPYEVIPIGSESYFVVGKQSGITGWTMVLMIPQREIMGDMFVMQLAAVCLLIGIALLMLWVLSVLYLQILNPIKTLLQSMGRVEKGLPFRPVPIKRMDELGMLQQKFNEMVRNEQQMRSEIYAEQLHNKEMELKFLQSQVNPHFLYNTLDSIYWVAEERGMGEVSGVVLNLSKFFRLSLSRGKDFLTVDETVEHLKSYISIQQFRHLDKFDVRWEVDARVGPVQIMKLMLQPVVENAIIHGLERAADACRLTIRIGLQEEWLHCEVMDTGAGMAADRLERVMEEIRRLDLPPDVEGTTYGLRNLYQRLRIQYGDDMQFQMWSRPREGTCVTIRIRWDRLGGAEFANEGDDRRG